MAFTAPIFTKLRTVPAKGGGGGAGTNYRALAVRKGARDPTVLHMFLSF
jgi:hypothetical protein